MNEINHWACLRNDTAIPCQIGGDIEEINNIWLQPNEAITFDVQIPKGLKLMTRRVRRRGVEKLLVHFQDKDF